MSGYIPDTIAKAMIALLVVSLGLILVALIACVRACRGKGLEPQMHNPFNCPKCGKRKQSPTGPMSLPWCPDCDTVELHHCQAAKDGECVHPACPQLMDGEPEKTGRSCPLAWRDYDANPEEEPT